MHSRVAGEIRGEPVGEADDVASGRAQRKADVVGFEELALGLAEVALRSDNKELFDALPENVNGGDYTFVGWSSADRRYALDDDGKVIGKPQPGDSWISKKETS